MLRPVLAEDLVLPQVASGSSALLVLPLEVRLKSYASPASDAQDAQDAIQNFC